MENTRKSRISEFDKVVGYKSAIQKLYVYILGMDNQTENTVLCITTMYNSITKNETNVKICQKMNMTYS